MRRRYCILKKVLFGLNSLAFALVVQTANVTCLCVFHQPEFPEEAKRFNRIQR